MPSPSGRDGPFSAGFDVALAFFASLVSAAVGAVTAPAMTARGPLE